MSSESRSDWWMLPKGLCLLAVAACVPLHEPTPAPEYFDLMEPLFTVGVPPEAPLPELDTEHLGPEEANRVRVHRERHRAVVNVTSLSAHRGRSIEIVPSMEMGSGAIIDSKGIVVSNHHVVAGGSAWW